MPYSWSGAAPPLPDEPNNYCALDPGKARCQKTYHCPLNLFTGTITNKFNIFFFNAAISFTIPIRVIFNSIKNNLYFITIERIIFKLRMRFFAPLRSSQNDSYLRF